MAPNLPPPENKVFYPALDGMRAFAILLVFSEHYILTLLPASLRWGWTGVDFFFVLSGFLITGILYDTRNASHRFRNFYVRRSLRIFPLYYGVLLATLMLTPVFHWTWSRVWFLWPFYLGNYARFADLRNFHPGHDPMNILFSRRTLLPTYFGHFWSICVEEQFYLAWPVLVFFIRNRIRLRNLCFGVILIEPILRLLASCFASQRLLQADLLYLATPLRLDALLLGAALALMLRGDEAATLRRFAGTFFALVTPCFLLMVCAKPYLAGWPAIFPHLMDALSFTVVDFTAAGVLLLALNPDTLVFRLFTLKPLQRLGQVSYGFYVFHYLPAAYYDHYLRLLIGRYTSHVQLILIPVAFLSTLALSLLSFRYFEAPFLRLKGRFTV